MRALPSSSRDLPLLSPEWILFGLLQMAACRTLEMLARGTGLRGDATRAPMQVRNGWRPHRRHLTQPASLSKDEPIFVQTMGSTSELTKTILYAGYPVIEFRKISVKLEFLISSVEIFLDTDILYVQLRVSAVFAVHPYANVLSAFAARKTF
jgi:hypothetical protein